MKSMKTANCQLFFNKEIHCNYKNVFTKSGTEQEINMAEKQIEFSQNVLSFVQLFVCLIKEMKSASTCQNCERLATIFFPRVYGEHKTRYKRVSVCAM